MPKVVKKIRKTVPEPSPPPEIDDGKDLEDEKEEEELEEPEEEDEADEEEAEEEEEEEEEEDEIEAEVKVKEDGYEVQIDTPEGLVRKTLDDETYKQYLLLKELEKYKSEAERRNAAPNVKSRKEVLREKMSISPKAAAILLSSLTLAIIGSVAFLCQLNFPDFSTTISVILIGIWIVFYDKIVKDKAKEIKPESEKRETEEEEELDK